MDLPSVLVSHGWWSESFCQTTDPWTIMDPPTARRSPPWLMLRPLLSTPTTDPVDGPWSDPQAVLVDHRSWLENPFLGSPIHGPHTWSVVYLQTVGGLRGWPL
uniref:Uncharacterized protein n=1 Tax=Solanum tuberosum TaxID=4113 RepID=M1DWL1_SOLTU